MPRDDKALGAYFTPESVARALVRWAVRRPADRLLDPASGDGRFVALHPNSVGVECDPASAAEARRRAPRAEIVEDDFFTWAAGDRRRFDCAAGNPPFIRYQRFTGTVRRAAFDACRRLGVTFSGLSSSWAPFIAAAAGALRPGGRLAFVVPAEIGHAPYAAPLLDYLAGRFASVHVVAVREKFFPRLSEDCWLLFAEGAGDRADGIRLSAVERFDPGAAPPPAPEPIPLETWRGRWRGRLRPFLLPPRVRGVYERLSSDPGAVRLGDIARVGVGYVSGANRFFHLRPSDARRFAIPDEFLAPSIRNGRYVTRAVIDDADVERWVARDDPVLLLRIPPRAEVPAAVRAYLDTAEGRRARAAYKCRNRTPWYSVPDVRRPEFVLTYHERPVSGAGPQPRPVRVHQRAAGRRTARRPVRRRRLRPPGAAGGLDIGRRAAELRAGRASARRRPAQAGAGRSPPGAARARRRRRARRQPAAGGGHRRHAPLEARSMSGCEWLSLRSALARFVSNLPYRYGPQDYFGIFFGGRNSVAGTGQTVSGVQERLKGMIHLPCSRRPSGRAVAARDHACVGQLRDSHR